MTVERSRLAWWFVRWLDWMEGITPEQREAIDEEGEEE